MGWDNRTEMGQNWERTIKGSRYDIELAVIALTRVT